MKRLLLIALVCLASVPSFAGAATKDQAWSLFDAITSVTTTSSFNVASALPKNHTVSLVVSGTVSTCTANLDGSLDNTNWFDLSGNQTCTSNKMFHVDARPVSYIRVNVTVLSGAGATVTASYVGTR